jgi:site-specific recombinase XerD
LSSPDRVTLASLARPGRTLAELVPPFLSWFQFVRLRSDNTVRSYGDDFKSFLEFCAAADLERPEQVTFRHLEFYLGWLQKERGLKPHSANRHLHAIKSLYRYLVREEIVTTNPATDCFMLPTQRKLPGYLTVPEQARVLSVLAKSRSWLGQRDYALVATGLLTGLRCAELAALQLAHVNLEAGRLHVVNGKGGKDREAVITQGHQGMSKFPPLAEVLKHYFDK